MTLALKLWSEKIIEPVQDQSCLGYPAEYLLLHVLLLNSFPYLIWIMMNSVFYRTICFPQICQSFYFLNCSRFMYWLNLKVTHNSLGLIWLKIRKRRKSYYLSQWLLCKSCYSTAWTQENEELTQRSECPCQLLPWATSHLQHHGLRRSLSPRTWMTFWNPQVGRAGLKE